MATITRKMKIVTRDEPVPVPEVVCPHCERTEKQCEEQTNEEKNPITHWMGWGLSCDECYYENHPEESEDDDETETDEEEESEEEEEESEEEEEEESEEEEEESEPESEDAECQTEPLPVTAVGVSERRVYGIVDDQVSQMEETLMERLADMRRQMMEETERIIAQKLATLAVAHPTIQKQTKKAEKEKKKEEEVKGFYEVTNWEEEVKRLRGINRELRKTSEGQINTNRKLQEKIANLESEDPVAEYVAEIKKVRGISQQLRKRCEAKDRTYQKMKAMIEALGGKAPAQEE
jgi:hypothetical protein